MRGWDCCVVTKRAANLDRICRMDRIQIPIIPSVLSLHSLRNFDSQQVKPPGQDAAAQFAQGETRTAGGLLRFQDWAGFVEAVEGVGQLVEIVREQVRTEIVQDGGNGL